MSANPVLIAGHLETTSAAASLLSPPVAKATDPATPAAVTLPAIRQATAWGRATDELLAALEREEAAALGAFEAARERAKAARRAAGAMRQLRAAVSLGEPAAKTARLSSKPGARSLAETDRWAKKYDACVNCSTTEIKHAALGRCRACATYFARRGAERPIETSEKENAS